MWAVKFPWIDDAPILGLLVRVWKLMKEVIRYYKEDNGEIIGVLERPLIEAAVTASFLMGSTHDIIEDYRKCSYKDRLRLLRDMEAGSPFFDTKAGKRLLASVREKLALENLDPDDFEMQKKNRWRIQGKTFHAIFSEVEHADLYAYTYGMMSESVHGSWNESLDWCLTRKDDGTFAPYPFSHPADVRYLSPILRFTNRPYRLWLQRIDAYDENLKAQLDWIDRVNGALFRKFDTLYDGEARMTGPIGILAYGSLLSDPGKEITACQTGTVEDVETPFPVEFARSSGSRGGAPTLIPVEIDGAKVRGRVILVSASLEEATNMLYRREIHQVGSGKSYKEPTPEQTDRVRVKILPHFHGVESVLYTDLSSNISTVTAEKIARLAIESVACAETGKDGLTYLIAAKANGIRTALSGPYEKEILRMTGDGSLEDALHRLQLQVSSRQDSETR